MGLHKQCSKDFLERTGFKGQLVVNEKMDVFAEVAEAGYLSLLSTSLITKFLKAQALRLGGTIENLDGFQLGGLVVIDPPPKGAIIYQWDQPKPGVYPPVDEVLKKSIEGMGLVGSAAERTRKRTIPAGGAAGAAEMEVEQMSLVELVSATLKRGNIDLIPLWIRSTIDGYFSQILSMRFDY